MDLIVDGYGHAILVLLECLTGFVMMERLPSGKRSKPLAATVVRMLFAYRKYLKTITTDNGSEFSAHLDITPDYAGKGLMMSSFTSPTATAPGRRVLSKMSIS